MCRLIKFESFISHPWLGKAYKKLSLDERIKAREFIIKNADMDKGMFEMAVNRLYIDKEKPKNWTIIIELLTCANSAIPSDHQ